jgi:cytochrome P450
MAYLLARHPEWQDRLRAEAQRVGSERLQLEDTKRMEETDWVWKETLRLYPVASDVPRMALRDVEVGGHRIPAGALALALIGPAMHDPNYWTEPSKFDPERFSPARAEDKRAKGIYLPFGAGAHACIGAQLATAEVKAFWHTLLRRCRIRLASDRAVHHEYRPIGIVSGQVELILEPL